MRAASDRGTGSGAVLGEETVCLVLHVGRQLGELRSVLTRVVRAEQQLSHREDNSDIGLCAAAVAAVGRGQEGCQCSGHVSLLSSVGPQFSGGGPEYFFDVHHRVGVEPDAEPSTFTAMVATVKHG